jgi:hypothetical protein
MPVIVAPTAPADVQALLRQYPADGMESFPVRAQAIAFQSFRMRG